MNEALSVFLTGIVGVFAGMTLLYVTVRLNAFVAGRIEARLARSAEAGASGSGAPGDEEA